MCLSVCLCTRIGGDMHSNERLLVLYKCLVRGHVEFVKIQTEGCDSEDAPGLRLIDMWYACYSCYF